MVFISFLHLSPKICKSPPSSQHTSVSYEARTESDQCQVATTQWQGTEKYMDEEQLCRQREVKSSVQE